MADLDSCRRTKRSCDYRKGTRCQSWIWCFLMCFISLPSIFSKCLGVDITVAVYPQGDINIEYGNPLEIFCVAEKNTSVDNIRFTLGTKGLASEIVNRTTRRLYIKEPEKQASTYYCTNIETKRICTARVLVESPPSDITDFKCLSKNLDILNCSWTSPESYSKYVYNLTFLVSGKKVKDCEVQKFERTSYCVWNTTSEPRYKQLEEELHFNLTACNVFGCNSQNFIIDHFSIVKPDPPTDLKVIRYGAHSVVLKWGSPNNMVDLLKCGVEHIIQYQIAKVDDTAYFRKADTSNLPLKNKTYTYNLTGLPYAYMRYEVKVYIKSKKATSSEFLSDYAFVMFTTSSERPKRPPDMIAGGFDQVKYNDYRIINVYWKQLEEFEKAGSNFTYKAVMSQDSRTQTVYPDEDKSMSYVSLNATLDPLHVTVWSSNVNGKSMDSSHIYIPNVIDSSSLKVLSFTKLAYENGTYELYWDELQDIDNYTLIWCQHNESQLCVGRLDFAVLDPRKNNHKIDLPRENRYQFAISANSGTKTSGMTWAVCDTTKDRIAMYRYDFLLDYGAPTNTSVTLKWVSVCKHKDGIITGYNISYCPTIKTTSYCDKSLESKYEYIQDPKQTNVTITKLLPYKTYQFNLTLNTIHGQKNIEKAAFITTTQGTPSSPVNIVINNVRNDSITLLWDPPLNRNGVISRYLIWKNDEKAYEEQVPSTDTSRRQITLRGLQPYTNYSISVQACNTICSVREQNSTIFVRTNIGAPSKLRAPSVRSDADFITWEQPTLPGGTVNYYQIRQIKDDSIKEIFNSTSLSYSLTPCENGRKSVTYEVRAVNIDMDMNHGALGGENVTLPVRTPNDLQNKYPGPWSEPSQIVCQNVNVETFIMVFMAIFALLGLVYCSIKLYKKYRKMEDIKPVLPNGLEIPEKDISKYSFSSWNPTNKDEKPSSDEMLLLPNSKATVTPPENKQKDDNCAASDHTDSTALSSDSSRGPIDRQASTSEDSSNSSTIEVEHVKCEDNNINQEEDSSVIDTECSPNNSPYFSDKTFKKNPTSGYVQPVVNPESGYVQSAPAPLKVVNPPINTSYVMAGLPPPLFSNTKASPPALSQPQPSSGYVLPEEAQARSMVNFPKLGHVSPKLLGPESLPTMPTLPPLAKHAADNSYIQLQSLDSLPNFKPNVHTSVPLKPAASSGYVSPTDVVINKHLNNILVGQHAEESAILDPTMSPDAYCRFSWSTDPANDNLHTLLAESPARTPKN